jgi:LUC7 N_terminus
MCAAGEQGKVDESMREMAAIEALKSEKADKEVSGFNRSPYRFRCFEFSQRELQQLTDTSGASGHQKLRVCDVCGAYLSVLDSDRRLADHFGGKVCLWSPGSFRFTYGFFAALDALGLSRTT